MELDRTAINEALKKLKLINLETSTIKNIEEILTPLFFGYKISAPKYNKGVLIFRGRVCDKPKYYNEIIYPKHEFIKNYGRANDISVPIFYAGVGKGTPLSEINAKSGDTVILSHWITTEGMTLNHIGFSNLTKFKMKSNRDLEKIYKFVGDTKNYSELNTFVYNFLASKFVEEISETESWKYKLSIAITNKLLGSPFNGLMYPSIKSFGNADNIVLQPEFVDTALKLVSIEFYKINNRIGHKFQIELLDTATEINHDGTIMWSGRELSIANTSFIPNYENGEIVSREENGEFIFPKSEGNIIKLQTSVLKAFKKNYPKYIKIAKEITFTIEKETYNPIVEIAYDIQNSKSFVSFYIPFSSYAFIITNELLKNFNTIPELFKDIFVEIKELKNNTTSLTNKYNLKNKIKIFSEQDVDMLRIKKLYPNLQFTFCSI